jgi:hypothetical protein
VDQVSAIAQAVLYEGYLLWPYRRSATKNHQRWTFGAVFPPQWSAQHPDDPELLQAQCLLVGGACTEVCMTLRFLHVVDRRIWDDDGGGEGRWVDELEAAGRRHLACEEATERELVLGPQRPDALAAPLQAPLEIAGGSDSEPILGAGGERAGAVVRCWEALEGTVELRAEPLAPRLRRLTVRVTNATPFGDGARTDALRRALVSTHLVLRATDGEFVSLTDPPPELADASRACENTGTWPVLCGEDGARDTLLCAPIILPDHPRVAPESPGDLFDATEIDRLLILSTLSMTDAERREAADTDPRAREILERCAALTPQELMRLLDGAIRELRVVREP